MASYRRGLKTERVLGLEMVSDMYSGRDAAPSPTWLWPARVKNDQCAYLDFMSLGLSMASKPYDQVRLAPELHRPRFGIWADLIAPAIDAAHIAMNRGQTFLRALRVLNAIQRFEQAHPDVEPKLADLGLPAEATTDPFNGQPLHVKKLPTGWLIYSVGRNLKDDGGKIEEVEDVGLGPIEPAAMDKPGEKGE